MKKKTAGLLVAGAAIAAAATAASLGFMKILTNIAVRRKIATLPDSVQDKISGGLKTDPRTKVMVDASEAAMSLKTETVKIESRDGLTLTGHYYPAASPKRLIIAMHGWRSTWMMDYGCSVGFYHDEGCSLLYADQRGQNESDGDYIGFGVLERYDCLAWINYAVERFGKDIPIYLCGVSMGATTVLMTTGFELPENVKGVIADCGFTSPREIWEHILANNLHLNPKLTYPIANLMCKQEAQFDPSEYSTLDALKENKVPVLFVHGSDDKFVPLDMTFKNYQTCKAPKDLLIVPGAAHGMSFVTDTKAYKKAVKSFFAKCEHDGWHSADEVE